MREFNGRADMLAQGAINFHDPNWWWNTRRVAGPR
jgi:hypothetical protein